MYCSTKFFLYVGEFLVKFHFVALNFILLCRPGNSLVLHLILCNCIFVPPAFTFCVLICSSVNFLLLCPFLLSALCSFLSPCMHVFLFFFLLCYLCLYGSQNKVDLHRHDADGATKKNKNKNNISIHDPHASLYRGSPGLPLKDSHVAFGCVMSV